MMNLSNEFTLAFLPTDIIWTIFSCMDPGKEKLNNVRLVKKGFIYFKLVLHFLDIQNVELASSRAYQETSTN